MLFVNLFLFQPLGNVGLGMLMLSWWGWSYLYFGKKSKASKRVGWTSGILAMVSAGMVASVDSLVKVGLLVGLYGINWVLMVYSLVKGEGIGGLLESVYAFWWLGWEYVRSIFRMIFVALGLRKPLSVKNGSSQNGKGREIITGVLLGIPIVAWLVSLLSRADMVYAEFVRRIVSEQVLAELPGRMAISLVLLIILSPLLALTWRKYRSLSGSWRGKWGGEIRVITVMVTVVIGSFLVVQWPYVFAKVAQETDLSRFGVATYSEYVQRGFVELIQVVGIGYLVGWAGYLTTPAGKDKMRRFSLLISGLLGVEMMIFVASIIRRVLLYQSWHGLSLARMYGLTFLIVLVGMGGAVVGRYLRPSWSWAKLERAWIVGVIMVAVLANFEGRVIDNPPTVNGRVDYVYLSTLPADGYRGWGEALANAETKLAEMAAQKPAKLDAEERRELYYAGLVLQMTALRKDQLIWRYGSEKEVKDYMREITAGELIMLDKYPDEVNYSAGRSKQEYRAELEKALEQLSGKEWEKVKIIMSYPYYDSGEYTLSRYDTTFYGIHADWPGWKSRASKWGNMLTSNMSEKRAYEWLQQEVPTERLYQAMENYWQLKEVVMQGAESERKVEVDIAPSGLGWR